MARVNGLKALFKNKMIKDRLDTFVESYNDSMYQTLLRTGEDFVNKAKLSGNYKDRTGNLRVSIGYVILLDGKIVTQNFTGNKKDGVLQGQKAVKEVARKYTDGFILIGIAGMNYAAYVETRGYDVISGSAPNDEEIKSILREIKF